MNKHVKSTKSAHRASTNGNNAVGNTEHFDVVIVGAGISGIGSAYHLTKQCPGTSFVILETQESFGGTWLTHRYPGIRSDSDLYTFGYRFKPWIGAPIATAAEILAYLGEVIEENDLGRHIRYRHKINSAHWSSSDNRWTIEAVQTDTGKPVRFTANFLWMCQGYYRHSQGYTPEWPGMDEFKGRIVHPQTWPEDLDYKDKNVVVIGSGATAATIVPAMAADTRHITILQRSPTYFIPGLNENELANTLRELQIDESWIHEIVRRKILHDQAVFTRRSFTEPEVVKQELLAGVRAYLGPDFDIDKHFTPNYRPWRQRIAFVPDGDLFKGIVAGKASVVTDEIDRFTESGILLKSGKLLEADIVVAATGFNLNVLGDIDFVIDGQPLIFSDTVTYRGMMFHRRAQSRLGIRIFPGELDAEGRSDRRLRVPPAQPHEAYRREESHSSAQAGGQGHDVVALDRPRELQSGLCHARHAPAAETRRQAGMATHPRLLARKGHAAGHRPRRPRLRL
jgi:cation diffusion facilitator CzcD-associated flavoprotein CzcO